MNSDIKKRWVAALRSGEYEQGKFRLNKDNRFCCLGVLCELAVADGVVERGVISGYEDCVAYGAGEDLLAIALPPAEVMEWAGMESSFNLLGRYTLPDMNDSFDKDFNEIADAIEEYL